MTAAQKYQQDFKKAYVRGLKASEGKYPVPYVCTALNGQPCADFLRPPPVLDEYTVWARLSGHGSPHMQAGVNVMARCSHEAHYNVDLKQFDFSPKQVNCTRIVVPPPKNKTRQWELTGDLFA